MTFVIEKGIPAPVKQTGYKKKPQPPVADMEVGDSVIIQVPVSSKSGIGATNKCNLAARSAGLPHRFTSAKVGEGLYRVWRIA